MNAFDLSILGPRLEKAQADQNHQVTLAAARSRPGQGLQSLRVAGGFANYLGQGHVLNQALCLALDGPIPPGEFDQVEALLGQGGAAITLELPPFTDPSLPRLLAARGYRVGQFQLVFVRRLTDADLAPPPSEVRVRPLRPGEEGLFSQVVMAGFLDQDELPGEDQLMMPDGEVPGTTRFLAWIGEEVAGGGSLGLCDGIATLAGTSTLPTFRRRGVQAALVHARLAAGRAAGAELASTATLPGTASCRNMLRLGFEVLYPKVEMVRELNTRS
ncbi:MAG TPA: GNAT family N-acetyltransferase [Holophagaceae bacterium]|nr:GNAT family N-acetyltransferase [Holophagaceae bacterium]